MNLRATCIHVAVCAIVGGLVAVFTSAKWLAASFWISAAMYINGSLAFVEDTLPGGFDNPDGSATPSFAKGGGVTKYALQSLAVTLGLVALGCYIQFYL